MFTTYTSPGAGTPASTAAGSAESSSHSNYYSSSAWYNKKPSITEATTAANDATVNPPGGAQGLDYGYPTPSGPPTNTESTPHFQPPPYGARQWSNNWSTTFNDLANYYNNLSHQGNSYRANYCANGSNYHQSTPFSPDRSDSYIPNRSPDQHHPYYTGAQMNDSSPFKGSHGMNNNNNSICKSSITFFLCSSFL